MGTLDFPQALYAQHLLTVPMALLDADWIVSLQIPSLSIVVGLMLVSEPFTPPMRSILNTSSGLPQPNIL